MSANIEEEFPRCPVCGVEEFDCGGTCVDYDLVMHPTCKGCLREANMDPSEAGERWVSWVSLDSDEVLCDDCTDRINAAWSDLELVVEVDFEAGDYVHEATCPDCSYENEQSVDGPGQVSIYCRQCGLVFEVTVVDLV